MFTIRATQKLLLRAMVSPALTDTAPTTKLRAWYADLLPWRPTHLVLCVSERSLLPIVVPAADIRALPERLAVGLREVLVQLGVPEHEADGEIAEMQDYRYGRTANRKVVGSMNSFEQLMRALVEAKETSLEQSLFLANVPCRPLGWKRPWDVTAALFDDALRPKV